MNIQYHTWVISYVHSMCKLHGATHVVPLPTLRFPTHLRSLGSMACRGRCPHADAARPAAKAASVGARYACNESNSGDGWWQLMVLFGEWWSLMVEVDGEWMMTATDRVRNWRENMGKQPLWVPRICSEMMVCGFHQGKQIGPRVLPTSRTCFVMITNNGRMNDGYSWLQTIVGNDHE